MKFLQTFFLLVTVGLIAASLGCSGASTKAKVPVAVTMDTTPTSTFVNDTIAVTGTVTNDSASGGVTWSCAPAGTCGGFSSATSASGAAVTYTAPAALPASTVVITATSVTDATKSASSLPITINVTSAITTALSPAPPSSMAPGATSSIAATVVGDAAAAGVSWSCTPVNACGSFNPTQTATAVSTVYTAPSTTGNVVVYASSVTDNAKWASSTVTVTGAASGALAPGNYVFSTNGADPYSVTGVFTATSGGVITTGEQDRVDLIGGAVHDAITGGTWVVSTDGNLVITLVTADVGIGVAGVETLDGTLISSTKALLTEFDASATSSGTLDLQISKAAPSGGYAFSAAGVNSASTPLALGGVLNVDSAGTISGTGSIFDINDAAAAGPLQNQTFTASTVSTPDALGMVTFTLNPSVASAVKQLVLVGYIVDSTHIRLVETTDTLAATLGGVALGQGTSVGAFSASSVSGSSFVIGAAGADTNGALQLAGVLTTNSDGTTVDGNLSYNDIVAQTAQGGVALATGATYTVASTGRVTLTGLTDAGATFVYNLQLYLTGDGRALVVSMDTTDIVAGVGFVQSGTFNAASFTGSYGLNVSQVIAGNEYDGVGPVVADGVGTLAGFVDLNKFMVPAANLPLTGAFTAHASGVFTGTLTGINAGSAATVDTYTYYVVDGTKIVAIENDADQLALGYFDLQQ